MRSSPITSPGFWRKPARMGEVSPATLGALLREARRRLARGDVDDPALEARLIVEHYTKTTLTDAVVAPERAVEESEARCVLRAVDRRLEGTPVYRILGYREFHGLRMALSPETLEPRPDTEVLVDLALEEACRVVELKGHCRILDLGTGTGAVAIALLNAVPQGTAVGGDFSPEALATAKSNADMLGVGARFTALQSDWLASVDGTFDLIVSNPPYIPTRDVETLSRGVREHDPMAALDGGADGLVFYRKLARDAHRHLDAQGAIVVEMGYDQRRAVEAVFAAHGFRLSAMRHDLAGHERAMSLRFGASW